MHCFNCLSKKKPVPLYLSYDRMHKIAGDFLIQQCPTCKLLSVSPHLNTQQLSFYYPSSSYYSYFDSGSSVLRKLRSYLIYRFYHPTVFSKILFLFVNTIPAIPKMKIHGKLMDVGCGNGETLRILKKHGWDVYGVDIDEAAVRYAKKSGLMHVQKGTHESLSRYPDNFFDVIRAYHVIEHMDSPEKFVKLAFQKLQRGGELIIGTPNGMSLTSRVFGSCWYNLDTPRHQYIFSPSNLKKMLYRMRFRVTDLQFSSGGGFLGSIQYFLSDRFGWKFQLIHSTALFFLFYPLDFVTDKMHMGDVFVMSARKSMHKTQNG